MESANCNNLKTQLIEADPNAVAFQRRNRIIFFIFLCFIITLALVLASSFFYILHDGSDSSRPPLSPAVEAYFSVASNTPPCLDIFMETASIKSDAEPNLILYLSLLSAAEDLDTTLAEFILPNSDTEPAFKNCADSLLRDGSGHIRRAIAALRVNPFVEAMGGEDRSEMLKWMAAAERDVNACVDDLRKGESAGVREVREKMVRVKAYVRSGEEFVALYDVVMRRFTGEIFAGADEWRRKEVWRDVVILCLSGGYLGYLLCTILREI